MAAVAALHQHIPRPGGPPSSQGDSPIFLPLDTPLPNGVSLKTGDRRGSIDDGLRRFQRASSDPAGGPPSAQVTSSKLDQEPNPFEQSFSAKPAEHKHIRRARSQSPVSAARTPSIPGQPKLPPLASLASPTHGTGIGQFGWAFDSSLRSGPLSPAMLTAPTNQPNMFDPTMRTGFTPQVTQNTWGPDTPGTAAFFASLTHGTPDLAGTMASTSTAPAQAPQQRVHQDGPNHFEATFARAMSGQVPTSMPPSTTADMALYQTQPAPRPLGVPGPPMPPVSNGIGQAVIGARADPGMYGQHNPLYLLSQGVAQHELANSSDDTVIAAAALSKLTSSAQASFNPSPSHLHPLVPPQPNIAIAPQLNGVPAIQTVAPPPGRGKGRGSSAGSPPSTTSSGRKRKNDGEPKAPTAKAAKGAAGKRATKARAPSFDMDDGGMYDEDEMMMDDDDESKPGKNRSGKPETDEEKRRNFLERNRQAALKCRQRKKAWLANLQAKVEYLTSDNETLTQTVNSLREEIASLRTVLIAHKDCPVQMPNGPTTVAAMLSQQVPPQRYA